MQNNLIPFGLLGDEMVGVEQVERGLACGCVCPNCRAPLVARKGEYRTSHFAHAPGHPVCESAFETALHRMAKQILQEEKVVKLPALTVKDSLADESGKIHYEMETVAQAGSLAFDHVELEVDLGDIRPDAIVHTTDSQLLIEVFGKS